MSSGQKAYFVLLSVMILVLAIFFWKGRNLNSRTHALLNRINAEIDHMRPPDATSDEVLLKRVNARAGSGAATTVMGSAASGVSDASGALTATEGSGASAASGGSADSTGAVAAAPTGASGDGPVKGGIGEAIQKIRNNRAAQDKKLEDAAGQ